MNAPAITAPTKGEPTLAQRLRVIDLSFECARRASAIIDRAHPEIPFGDERRKRIGSLALELRRQAMVREGLPASLLGDGETATERHYRKLDELLAEPRSHLCVAPGVAA